MLRRKGVRVYAYRVSTQIDNVCNFTCTVTRILHEDRTYVALRIPGAHMLLRIDPNMYMLF